MTRQEATFVTGRDPLASFAFAAALGLLLTIPYAGPLLCILAHAAAPLALLELMLDQQKPRSVSAPPPEARPLATATAVVGDTGGAALGRMKGE